MGEGLHLFSGIEEIFNNVCLSDKEENLQQPLSGTKRSLRIPI